MEKDNKFKQLVEQRKRIKEYDKVNLNRKLEESPLIKNK